MRYALDTIILKTRSEVDPKMVRDTPPSQDASTHQIWDSYLKEYKEICTGHEAGWTDEHCDYYKN